MPSTSKVLAELCDGRHGAGAARKQGARRYAIVAVYRELAGISVSAQSSWPSMILSSATSSRCLP